jgi:hypothetical protein
VKEVGLENDACKWCHKYDFNTSEDHQVIDKGIRRGEL